MSDHVTLTLRSPLTESIEADSIIPSTFGSRTDAEIASLPIWSGRLRRSVGDYFAVNGGRSSSVRVVGDVRRAHGIGAGMTDGDLVIDGDAGSRLATGMIGGRVDVLGNAGDDLGVGMAGGSIRVRRDAGDRVAAAPPGASRGTTGGEIVVEGSVGADAGARMRRGLLFIGGNAGNRAARCIIAGTVVVMGRVGSEPAYASKRGSLIVAGGVDVPVTYRYACDFEPPHVRLVLTYLARRYRLAIPRSVVEGRYRRYCGDAGTVGRGEILEWVDAMSFRAERARSARGGEESPSSR